MSWSVVYTRQAEKDAVKASRAGLRPKVETLLKVIERDPFQNPPPYKSLVGDLAGAYSRRISLQHRLVYQVYAAQRVVKVLRMWTHYG